MKGLRLPRWLTPKSLMVLPIALIAALVIGVPLDMSEQWFFAGIVMAGALVMKRWKGRKGAMALGLLAVMVCTRYMFWRTP